ncbi:MAG: hypothetical protein HRU49_08110 [Winogradskyella sp.]|uniref:hypothetical protein n=1 Tax=Winogradskyella sp. TaxID=1883156 RepID=UPI0025D123B0|nr:hypothetical protein [Winogradskyella sp.]NRB83723.1 hypothetical protein [Winogradskyella sp.]
MKYLTLIMVLLMSLTISAQESAKIKKVNKVNLKSNSPKSLASTKTKSLNKALDLDKEQQVSVYNIFLEYFSKNEKTKDKLSKELNTDKKINKEKMKKRLVEHKSESNKALDEALKGVLSSDQYSRYDKMKLKSKNY